MKLAFLIRHFDPQAGGAERYAYEVVNHLRHRHECHVFCISHRPLDGVHVHLSPNPDRRPRWLSLLRFARWTRRETQSGFDAIFSNENLGFGDVQMVHVRPIRHDLFHRSWLKSVINGLRVLLTPGLWVYLGMEHLRLRPRPGRVLVVPSEMTAHQLTDDLHCDAARVKVVLPGVNPASAPHNPHWIQQRWGLTDRHRLILLAAHDLEKKGLPLVLQAMPHWPEEVHLLVTPDKWHQDHWVKLVESLQLSHRVHWLDRGVDLNEVYPCAHVLVHPTRADVYGMVVLEAMAHGLPVICSPSPFCGAAWHWTTQHEAWLLDSPDDVQGLITGLRRLLEDDDLRQGLVQRGRRLAQQQTWADVATRIEAQLKGLPS